MTSGPDAAGSVGITAALLLMIFSGLFVAAQRSISDVNRNHIRELAEKGDRRAARLVPLFDRNFRMIVRMMVAVTFSGFIAAQLVAFSHMTEIEEFFKAHNVPLSEILALLAVSVAGTVIFSAAVLFLPRQIARQHTEGVALALGGYAKAVMFVTAPLSYVVIGLTNIILRIFRQHSTAFEESYSEDDVISMLEIGQESGALKEEGRKMISSIFEFDDKLAYEIMTPRTDVFAIDINDDNEEFIDELMEMRYSRIPVYEDDSDNIIGILNIKDYLIKAREKGFEAVNIVEILRDPFLVPETKNIDSLFFELQKTKQHIAILIDEYGGFSGIVTMEDIIEEVMGDIDDEYDEEENEIQQLGDGRFLIDGYADIDDVNEETGANLYSETSETIGGLIIDILGEIPDDDPDESISVQFENYMFEVLNVRDRRIERVIMTVLPKEENPEGRDGSEKEKRKERRKEREKEKDMED